MNQIDELLTIVHRADFQEIEFARDRVTFSDLGALAAAYPELESWDQKAALINLVQDHLDPRFRPIMLDFLRAPDNRGDDIIPLTKAIALCHLDENFDDFMKYYNDQALLQARAQQLSGKTSQAQTKKAPKTIKRDSPWYILGTTAVIVGLALIIFALVNLHTLQKYRKEGMIVEARITDMSNEDGETCIGVSYFDKDLLEGGELYLTEVCDFVTPQIWDVARKGGHELVIFLPEDPQNNTIFADSLENNQYPSISIGVVLLGFGLLVIWWQRRLIKRSEQD